MSEVAAYTPKPGDTLVPGSGGAVTEWATRVNGVVRGCGEAALAVLLGTFQGRLYVGSDVTQLVQEAIAKYHAGRGGNSTPSEIAALSKAHGVPLTSVNWQTALDQDAGKRDILLWVDNARALGGDNATADNGKGISGHVITVVGKTADGKRYIVSDPNTAASTKGQYVTYSKQQLTDAKPFAAQVSNVQSGNTAGISGLATGTLGDTSGISGQIASGISAGLASIFGTTTDKGSPIAWLKPVRIIKVSAGFALVLVALLIAFFPNTPAGQFVSNPQYAATAVKAVFA